jgi:hypothetical protein
MSTSDFLKALLEKKKAQTKQGNQKNTKEDTHGMHGSQVNVNKPTKKSAGRGR